MFDRTDANVAQRQQKKEAKEMQNRDLCAKEREASLEAKLEQRKSPQWQQNELYPIGLHLFAQDGLPRFRLGCQQGIGFLTPGYPRPMGLKIQIEDIHAT
jgi:hypothetical protein